MVAASLVDDAGCVLHLLLSVFRFFVFCFFFLALAIRSTELIAAQIRNIVRFRSAFLDINFIFVLAILLESGL